MKRLMAAIWTLLVMFLAILLLADYSNNKMVEKFNDGTYENNPMGFLGFMEPYVNIYNKGNVYYMLGQYELAQEQYELALESNPDEREDCRLRVNLALSLVAQINPNEITDENLEDVLAILDEARDVLCENGCASRDDDSGHFPDAQRLKNEIDEFYDSLVNPPSDDPEPSEDPSETPTPTPEGSETPTPTPEGSETPTPSPEGSETPTPSPGDGETPTPTPEDGGDTPTPTPGGGEGDSPTPTPTMTPEEEILYIQGLAQEERYAGANGEPDESGGYVSGTPW